MDLEYVQNVLIAERRYIDALKLGHSNLFDLVCALKVNNYQTMQCLTSVSAKSAVLLVTHGAALIDYWYKKNGVTITILTRPERTSLGEWLVQYSNLISELGPAVSESNTGRVMEILQALFIAMVAAMYQFGARVRGSCIN